MNDKVWDEVKSFYREKFGTAPEMVELAPILDLLRLCASGSSNKSIAKFFGETEEGLMELFDAHLGFMGWKQDLSFSPLKLYKELDFPDKQKFVDAVITKYGYTNVVGGLEYKNLDMMHESARLVDRLERLFDEAWI